MKKSKFDENKQPHEPQERKPSLDVIFNSSPGIVTSLKKYGFVIEIILLVLIIAAGIFLRLDDLSTWQKYEHRAMFNGQPLHTTFDAWYYLNLAKDIVEGSYGPRDSLRGVPNPPPTSSPAPLISVLAAYIAKISTWTLSWIGAILPAVLGPLVAVPLYLLGRRFGGPPAGFCAALLSVFFPFYIHRSNIGRFDTDCMNITWASLIALLFLYFGIEQTRKRYFYFVAAILSYGLFLWWWDQAPSAVTAITVLPFLTALVFYYRPTKREGAVFYGLLAAAAAAMIAVKGWSYPLSMLQALLAKFQYISKTQSAAFPNIGITISEQSRTNLAVIISYTTKNGFLFFFCIAGLALLIWNRFRESMFLIALIVLSAASFFANRFLLFMIPILGLGGGYALAFIWKTTKKYRPVDAVICTVLIIAFVYPLYATNKQYTQWPKESAAIVAGMDRARLSTPPDSVIWAWWDHGYALTYYARRATINDGSIHSGERTVYTAIPFAADSFRLAANFMQFYTVRGMRGLNMFYRSVDRDRVRGLNLVKDILSAGPERAASIIDSASLKPVKQLKTTDDWLSFFYPEPQRPVYLFLDELLTRIAHWWYWFGTWDIGQKNGTHPAYQPFHNIRLQNGAVTGSNGLHIDRNSGIMSMGTRRKDIKLSSIFIRTESALKKEHFYRPGYRFEMVPASRYGALMDTGIAESVFNKLFIRHKFSKKYFNPIALNTPFYQIWQVTGDRYVKQ